MLPLRCWQMLGQSMTNSLSMFFYEQEDNFASVKSGVGMKITTVQLRTSISFSQRAIFCVVLHVLCFVLLKPVTANQTAPCWGSARCRRWSSALCPHSSVASQSRRSAPRTDCWKEQTHTNKSDCNLLLSTSCHCFLPSSSSAVQRNLFFLTSALWL